MGGFGESCYPVATGTRGARKAPASWPGRRAISCHLSPSSCFVRNQHFGQNIMSSPKKESAHRKTQNNIEQNNTKQRNRTGSQLLPGAVSQRTLRFVTRLHPRWTWGRLVPEATGAGTALRPSAVQRGRAPAQPHGAGSPGRAGAGAGFLHQGSWGQGRPVRPN